MTKAVLSDRASLEKAVREGKDEATLLAWADALEEAGSDELAGAVRAIPELLVSLRAAVQALQGVGIRPHQIGVRFHRNWEGGWLCFQVDHPAPPASATPGAPELPWPLDHLLRGEHDALRVLLVRWDETNAGVEFIAKALHTLIVEMDFEGDGPADGDDPARGPFALARNQHLRSLSGAKLAGCYLRYPRA
jgi:hypothetical protein